MAKEIKILFGERVRKARIEKGLTQLDLATQLETDVRQIRRVEKGEVSTTIETAQKIANALGIPLYEFFKPE